MKIIIIGKGIIGLSLAEFFSRTIDSTVQVLSSNRHTAASRAAAANLATKGQVFARDPHFDLKLQGQRLYPNWLASLQQEAKFTNPDELSRIFSLGRGRDIFSSKNDCERQWNRILQSPETLKKMGLCAQQIERCDATTIEYCNEAWVNAEKLLSLLEHVCYGRGVRFLEIDALNLEEIQRNVSPAEHIILATGSVTTKILTRWYETIEADFVYKKRRWSFGGTLEISQPPCHLPKGISLLEVVPGEGPIAKLTFSGSSEKLFCSSISVKCADRGFGDFPEPADQEELESQTLAMTQLVGENFGFNLKDYQHQFHWGMRLGFGHSELVVESLPVPRALREIAQKSCLVAAGAHKSGFLFAPTLGPLVLQKMQHAKA